MNSILNNVTSVNDAVNGFVWGKVGLILLIGTGVLLTIVTKVFQISHLPHWWKSTIGSLFHRDVIGHSRDVRSISPFQALCTALARSSGCGSRRFSG